MPWSFVTIVTNKKTIFISSLSNKKNLWKKCEKLAQLCNQEEDDCRMFWHTFSDLAWGVYICTTKTDFSLTREQLHSAFFPLSFYLVFSNLVLKGLLQHTIYTHWHMYSCLWIGVLYLIVSCRNLYHNKHFYYVNKRVRVSKILTANQQMTLVVCHFEYICLQHCVAFFDVITCILQSKICY